MGSGGSPLLPSPLPAGPEKGRAGGQRAGPAGAHSGLLHGPSPAPRLLRSLVSLKQVIIHAAHYLVLADKETYHFDPEAPFLQMVSPLPHLLGAALCVAPS